MGQVWHRVPTPEEVEDMRRQGLRPVTWWLPDTTSPEFKAEAERQARKLAGSTDEDDVMDFVESHRDWDDA
ncbi:MAG: antitoxin MazE family protein [Caenispirillum bisanense]|nr:antitoxin MazE family protein [Caenispirillum bisanense]